ncbi:MAG: formate dehydrogenase accessory sulfurtransferase FdhD [Thermoplasmataceae archaeon]|jgi:FdhD protein
MIKLAENGSRLARSLSYSTKTGMSEIEDRITVEEPLQILVRREGSEATHIAYIMRTPLMDNFLAAGFLMSEGLINSGSDILGFEGVDAIGIARSNTITVTVSNSIDPEGLMGRRNFFVNSSCGICGKATISSIFARTGNIQKSAVRIMSSVLLRLPGIMRADQRVFLQTGGIHAAAIFDDSGHMIAIAEDIGRHNAVDKIVGFILMNRLQCNNLILQVSGRAGFEIIQKAAVSGIPIVSSISAPSSLAVETCESMGITLACFVRRDRFTVYSHPERIIE